MAKKFLPAASFKAFLEDAVREAQDILNLHDFRITLSYVERISPYSHLPQHDTCTFEIEPDFVYMEAEVSVSRLAERKFEEGKLRYLREDIVHELCHLITYQGFNGPQLRGAARTNEEENLTQKIANIASKQLAGCP